MSSVFAWLDQSEEQRRKVLDIVDLFREKGTVDELGFGTIRDALANILFDHLLPAEGGLPEDAAAYVRRGNALPVRRPEAAAGRVLVAVVNGLDYARHLVHMLIGGMPVAEFATASDFL